MFLAEQSELGQWMRATKKRSQCTIAAIRKLSTHCNNYRAFCTRPSNRYQHQHLRMYRLHPCWIPSLWNHRTWVGQCRTLRHFDLCAEPHGRRCHCCWTCGWVCDEGAQNAITWLSAASMTVTLTIVTSLTLISTYLLVSRLRSVAFSLIKGNIEWERQCLRFAVCGIRVEREGFTLQGNSRLSPLSTSVELLRQQSIFNDDIRKPNLPFWGLQKVFESRPSSSWCLLSSLSCESDGGWESPLFCWYGGFWYVSSIFFRENYPIEIYIVIYSTYRLNICHQLFDVNRSYC